ncbi:MAG: hypothetical protein ABSG63_03295 [Spirochaetia bacterium]
MLKNLPFRLESAFVRAGYAAARARHGSSPYISGDTFRLLAQHRFEQGCEERFDPTMVVEGELVYCESGLLRTFFSGSGCRIKKPFRLLTHNGDMNIDAAVEGEMPPMVSHWFAQNVRVDYPKVIPIPIGLENRRFHANGIVGDFQALRQDLPKKDKKNRIMYGFTAGTNPRERVPCREALKGTALANEEGRTNGRDYLRLLSSYRFVASPPGNGEDCHRTWEAMYLRVVPIVKRSVCMISFQRHGLPLLLIDDWREAASWNEKDLDDRYQALQQGFDSPCLWMDFWASLVGGAV